MVMSRKRRNLLSKKRKNGKRNTKRSTKTRKNIRKMRGGMNGINVGGIVLDEGSVFNVFHGNNMTVENTDIFDNTRLKLNVNYKVERIDVDGNFYIFTVYPIDDDEFPIDENGNMVDLNLAPRISIRKTVLDNKDIFKLEKVEFNRNPE